MSKIITINRDMHEKFVFPVDKIAYVKFNDLERKITIATTGAEAIFFNIIKGIETTSLQQQMNTMKLKLQFSMH